MAAPAEAPLLAVERVSQRFVSRRGVLQRSLERTAVEDVSFTLSSGETLAVVGESGAGKTTLARVVARVLGPTQGTITFDGRDVSSLDPRALAPVRRSIQLVFQDADAALDPRMRVSTLVAEPLEVHGLPAGDRVPEVLERVHLHRRFMDRYPHELSGGEKQRVLLARALALSPRLLVLDEPVSSLDVSVGAQILDLLLELSRDLGLSMVFVSHDLRAVRAVATRVAVMRAGRFVEAGPVREVFHEPAHAYTRELLAALPRIPVPG